MGPELSAASLALFYFQRTERAKWGARDFLACIDVAAAWQRKGGFIFTTLYDYLWRPLQLAEAWNFRTLNFVAAILALGVGFFGCNKNIRPSPPSPFSRSRFRCRPTPCNRRRVMFR